MNLTGRTSILTSFLEEEKFTDGNGEYIKHVYVYIYIYLQDLLFLFHAYGFIKFSNFSLSIFQFFIIRVLKNIKTSSFW